MDQREFLSQLIEELKYLKPKDANEVVKFYQQKISTALDYGEKEEKIIANLPSPKKIAEDIYKTKGIAYIDLRKKEMKRQAIFSFIGSIIITIIIGLIFTYITYLFATMSINLFNIMFQINSFTILDKITLIITGILILLIELIAYIYIIDLCYSMIMYFISGPIYQLKNKKINPEIANFTISGLFNKIIKQEKVLIKAAILLIFIALISGIINYSTKGYLYRSGVDNASIKEEHIVTNQNINKIIYTGSKANFTITSVDNIENITIEYYHEFNHNFELKENNNTLEIVFSDAKNLDILNILKEPTQIVVIKIPSTYQLIDVELNITESNINLMNANLNNVKIINNVGTYQIYNSKLTSLDIKTNKGIVKTSSQDELYQGTNNQITNLTIDILNGEVELINIFGSNSKLTNSTAKFNINNLNYNELTINSSAGELLIDNIIINQLNYETKSTMCTIANSKINNAEVKVVATSSLTLNKTIINEKIDSIVTGSYFILEFVKTPLITVKASSSTIYFYNLSENIKGDNLSILNQEYNSLDILPVINLENESSTKVAIDNDFSNLLKDQEKPLEDITNIKDSIKTLNIKQTKGVVSIKNAKVIDIVMDLNEVNVEMKNVYGNPYHITIKSGYLTFNNEQDTNQEIYLEKDVITQVELSNNIKKVK